jgi:predicted aspartyl protease
MRWYVVIVFLLILTVSDDAPLARTSQKMRFDPPHSLTVPMHPNEHRTYSIEVYINGGGPFRLVVDTGAAVSTLPKSILEGAGALPIQLVRMSTMDGRVGTYPLYNVEWLTIGGCSIPWTSFVGTDDAGMSVIGTNVFERLMTVSQEYEQRLFRYYCPTAQ